MNWSTGCLLGMYLSQWPSTYGLLSTITGLLKTEYQDVIVTYPLPHQVVTKIFPRLRLRHKKAQIYVKSNFITRPLMMKLLKVFLSWLLKVFDRLETQCDSTYYVTLKSVVLLFMCLSNWISSSTLILGGPKTENPKFISVS